VAEGEEVVDGLNGSAYVVHVHRGDLRARELAVEDERKAIPIQFEQGGVVGAGAGEDQAVGVAAARQFDVGFVGVIRIDGAEEEVVAVVAGGAGDALEEAREEGVSVGSIRPSVPDEGDGVGLAADQTASGDVGVIVESASGIEHPLASLWADLDVWDVVEDEGDGGTGDTRQARHIAGCRPGPVHEPLRRN
jgi:hypothetical protein